MGYRDALQAAGADVIAFQMFGDYQGTWVAKVIYEGANGWVIGGYGSCSSCDAFEGEFGWSYQDEPNYEERLKKFGESYLQRMLTQDEIEHEYKDEEDDWRDYKQIADYVRKETWNA